MYCTDILVCKHTYACTLTYSDDYWITECWIISHTWTHTPHRLVHKHRHTHTFARTSTHTHTHIHTHTYTHTHTHTQTHHLLINVIHCDFSGLSASSLPGCHWYYTRDSASPLTISISSLLSSLRARTCSGHWELSSTGHASFLSGWSFVFSLFLS